MQRKDIPAVKLRTALLCTCYVVGIGFNKGAIAVMDTLEPGTVFTLEHEAENPWDPNAVALRLASGEEGDDISQRVGYIPRTHNDLPSRLLASGFELSAALIEKDPRAKIGSKYLVAIYMHYV